MADVPPSKRYKSTRKGGETSKILHVANDVDKFEESGMSKLQTFHEDKIGDELAIPTLVVEIFMEWLKDVELLKTSRLVNKSWNSLACPSLQINCIAKVDDDHHERLEEFFEFQQLTNDGELPLQPSPFKNVHITTSEHRDRYVGDYSKLVENPNITITRLDISFLDVHGRSVGRLNQILRATMQDLTHLIIREFRCVYVEEVFRNVELPALKSLKLAKSIVECCHMKRPDTTEFCDFFKPLRKTLKNSRLQQLTTGRYRRLSPCAVSLFNINLSCIVELTLKSITNEEDTVWQQLPKLQLPSLKALTLNSILRDPAHVQDIEPSFTRHFEINSFLHNVASTLIKLDFCYGCPQPNSRLRFQGIVFPKLKYLFLTYPEEIYNCFTPTRFPSLQTLHLFVSDMEQIEMSGGFDPLETVLLLDIFLNIEVEDPYIEYEEGDIFETFPISMLNLARKFPNVESFGATSLQKYYSLSLLDRHEAYPNLKCLRHPTTINFTAPPGTSNDEMDEYKRAGRLIENIAKKPEDFDFKYFDCANCR